EEARKGYDFLVIGVEPTAEDGVFSEPLARIAAQFDGPYAIAAARGNFRRTEFRQVLDILVPVTGTAYSRRGAEVALALARADYGRVTALFVASPGGGPFTPFRSPFALGTGGNAILREIVEIGDRLGVPVRTAVQTGADPDAAILQQAESGG